MKISIIAFGILLGFSGVASAQSPAKGSQKGGQVPSGFERVDKSPVTMDEARATFIRTQKIISGVLNETLVGKVTVPEGTAPITRTVMVRELARQFKLTRPSFKFIPTAETFDASTIKMADPVQLANLKTLISFGCVARNGPLAVGPAETLSAHEFGDAVGFFLSRLAQLTHTPSRKWSPSLGAGG